MPSGGTRFQTPVWSLELAPGWRAEDCGDHVVILSDEPDTSLRLTSFDLPKKLTAAMWVEMVASTNRPMGRPVTEVKCGDFHGVRTEFSVMDSSVPPARDDEWLRGWALEYEGTPLDVTYRCPLWCAGRYDQDVIA